MKTANDYLAEKLQQAENSSKWDNLEARYWRKKYFDLLLSQGKTIKDLEEEAKKAMECEYL